MCARAKSAVHDADEKLKDRIALNDMKDRAKNAQAVDRAIASHRRMHKEIAGKSTPTTAKSARGAAVRMQGEAQGLICMSQTLMLAHSLFLGVLCSQRPGK